MKSTHSYACLLLLMTILSCESDPFTFSVGEEFVDPTTKVVIVDTFSIELSTMKMDSIITNRLGTILVGSCNEEGSGLITSKSYFQFGLPESYIIGEDEIYDSISLVLAYNDYYLGDTMMTQTLCIHQLTEELEGDSEGNIYSTTSFNYQSEHCGIFQFEPRPLKGDTLLISLEKELGKQLFDYLNGDMSEAVTTSGFQDFFQGLALVPSENPGNSILGFSASDSALHLKIHTHTDGLIIQENEIVLPLANSWLQYNQITCDWSNNPILGDVNEEDFVPASLTNDLTFMQGGLGLYTKVFFPNLEYITELQNTILVKALLFFEPVQMSNWDPKIIDELRIFGSNRFGEMDFALMDEEGFELTADSNLDEQYDEETYFVFDITSFMVNEISDKYIEPEMCFFTGFTPSALASTLERISLGANSNESNNMKLELTFFQYDQ